MSFNKKHEKRRKRYERDRIFEDFIISSDIKKAVGGRFAQFFDFKSDTYKDVDIERRRFK